MIGDWCFAGNLFADWVCFDFDIMIILCNLQLSMDLRCPIPFTMEQMEPLQIRTHSHPYPTHSTIPLFNSIRLTRQPSVLAGVKNAHVSYSMRTNMIRIGQC